MGRAGSVSDRRSRQDVIAALGAGLAGWAVRLARRDPPAQATAVVAAAGRFAAISTLLGSPLLGAFLLMEASGLAGATLGLVLVPGLVAAGVGSLIFVGLDNWTGLGTFSLALPDVPPFEQPDLAQFAWAIVIGVAAAVLLPACLLTGSDLGGYRTASWLALAGVVVGPQLLGHTVFNGLLAAVSASVVAVVMLLEPVIATALAWWLFDELPGPSFWAGAVAAAFCR